MPATTPVLLYDGDCGICREWVDYWLARTGERVSYRPWQSSLTDYPQLNADDCRRSIQYIDSDGCIDAGAAATFKLLTLSGQPVYGWLYRYLPGFAWLAECGYDFLARHRGLLARITYLLWGRYPAPARYERVGNGFIRGLGLIYFFAFASAGVQIVGLIGSDGLLPISEWLSRLHGYYGNRGWYRAPSVFWLGHADRLLQLVCLFGAVCGVLIALRRFTAPALVLAFALYLSVVHVGQDFFYFQWDLLLLESGFLAIFFCAWPNLTRWLYRWLLFRYVFMAGFAKLTGGDPVWRDLTALSYHFETQPLPTALAWYANQLPDLVLKFGTLATLIIEVVLVFLIFAPRRPRMLYAWILIVFQFTILLTGNYTFFNLLTILLTLWLFDDAALSCKSRGLPVQYSVRRPLQWLPASVLAILIILPGLNQMSRNYLQQTLPVAQPIDRALAPFKIVNPYGLFANMTTKRPEIVIEGSLDGENWRVYEFRFKPGALDEMPGWNIPHQPRLDWQMWFAALSRVERQGWFEPLLVALLENRPEVTALFAENPFPKGGPRFIRARLYRYRFTGFDSANPNHWWQREFIGWYYPERSLADIRNRSRGGLPFRGLTP